MTRISDATPDSASTSCFVSPSEISQPKTGATSATRAGSNPRIVLLCHQGFALAVTGTGDVFISCMERPCQPPLRRASTPAPQAPSAPVFCAQEGRYPTALRREASAKKAKPHRSVVLLFPPGNPRKSAESADQKRRHAKLFYREKHRSAQLFYCNTQAVGYLPRRRRKKREARKSPKMTTGPRTQDNAPNDAGLKRTRQKQKNQRTQTK